MKSPRRVSSNDCEKSLNRLQLRHVRFAKIAELGGSGGNPDEMLRSNQYKAVWSQTSLGKRQFLQRTELSC